MRIFGMVSLVLCMSLAGAVGVQTKTEAGIVIVKHKQNQRRSQSSSLEPNAETGNEQEQRPMEAWKIPEEVEQNQKLSHTNANQAGSGSSASSSSSSAAHHSSRMFLEEYNSGSSQAQNQDQDHQKQNQREQTSASVDAFSHCDLQLEKGICLYGGSKMIVADAAMSGLVARYSFDEHARREGETPTLLDLSGNSNHAADSGCGTAPGRMGKGRSGSFSMVDHRTRIPSSTSLQMGSALSLSMWIYIREPLLAGGGSEFPLLYKGTDANHPIYSLNLQRDTGNIAFLSQNANATSRASIRPRRWYHLCATSDQEHLKIYVNGVLDVTVPHSSSGSITPSNDVSSLFIAGSPQNSHPLALFIDDVSIYNRALETYEVEADSFPALGPVEPSFLRLGCLSCSANEAKGTCGSLYHVCKNIELHAGGFSAAHNLGWISHDSNVISFESASPPASSTVGAGTVLCCKGVVS
mmetsp:Transcript_10929/g.20065  ORF Transcript_10929/g.20065 Transcript_10929/m.20065 type:complete len:467 (-) Transcript_10929:98-1498(-)